ncbi:helix-turn-helix domain-containing protein [Paenibacillus terreus]|uniref:Helix-turn-helix domain-containing protein n=1 Tax=Paenibacillus terreus TaxID=1387834 RepID=A0ABV5BEN8_9BACL
MRRESSGLYSRLEEGMNEVNTAERLGISRTTLWRKIK